LAAAVVLILFLTGGGRLLTTVYGGRYEAGTAVIAWLAAMWAVRMARIAPTLAAMALGDTKNTMFSNVVRSLALAGMAVAAASGAHLVWVAISGLSGESLAITVSVIRLHRKNHLAAGLLVRPVLVVGAAVAISALLAHRTGGSWAGAIGAATAGIACALAGMMAVFLQFRAQVSALAAQVFSFGTAGHPVTMD
jgi:O-antigen/teichoic acid export membrane protein